MINLIVKYLHGELTPTEKEVILSTVAENETLRNNFVEFDHLLALLSLQPTKEDHVKAQKSLMSFLKKVDNNKYNE